MRSFFSNVKLVKMWFEYRWYPRSFDSASKRKNTPFTPNTYEPEKIRSILPRKKMHISDLLIVANRRLPYELLGKAGIGATYSAFSIGMCITIKIIQINRSGHC